LQSRLLMFSYNSNLHHKKYVQFSLVNYAEYALLL